MCNFLSGWIDTGGNVTVRTLVHHELDAKIAKIDIGTPERPKVFQWEWVDESPDSLSVRTLGDEAQAKYLKSCLMSIAKKRSQFIAEILRGNVDGDFLTWLASPDGSLYLSGLTSLPANATLSAGGSLYLSGKMIPGPFSQNMKAKK